MTRDSLLIGSSLGTSDINPIFPARSERRRKRGVYFLFYSTICQAGRGTGEGLDGMGRLTKEETQQENFSRRTGWS